jgi:hypothetical protein
VFFTNKWHYEITIIFQFPMPDFFAFLEHARLHWLFSPRLG